MFREKDKKFIRHIEANELIIMIAELGKNFFNHKDREGCCISYFTLEAGRTYFVDGYTKEKIYAYGDKYFQRSFTEGGTMQALVLDLAEFIRTGEATNGKRGYGGVFCPHWGYSEEDMEKIRNKAIEIGFVK